VCIGNGKTLRRSEELELELVLLLTSHHQKSLSNMIALGKWLANRIAGRKDGRKKQKKKEKTP